MILSRLFTLTFTRRHRFRGSLLALGLLLISPGLTAQSLLDLWEHVASSNPTLRSSEHMVEQMRAQQDQALSRLLPNASIRGNYGYNSYNRDVNGGGFRLYGPGNQEYAGYYGALQISQALFDLPGYLRLQSADRQTEANEQYALAQRMQVAFKLVDSYLAILEAQDYINQVDAELEAMQVQVTRIRRMHEKQLAKVTDLYEIEAYGQSLESTKIEAVHARAIATEKLREVTGVLDEHPDPLIQEEFPEMQRPADEWVEESLKSNPLLLSLQSGSEAAQKMIESAKAEHLPTLSVSLSETISNTINTTNTIQIVPYNIGSAYLNINIPLYSGGGIEAGVRESVQKYQVSREKIEEARRSIEKETRTSWLNVVAGRNRIESSRREASFREKAKIAQQKSYELGATTIVNVLDAHRRLLKAQYDFYKSKYEFIRNLVSLRLNAGSLADLDLEAIAVWFASVRPATEPEPKYRESLSTLTTP